MPDVEAPLSSCPVCGGAIALWRTKPVDGAVWRIDRCVGCGFAFVNPRPSMAFIMEYYEGTASIEAGPQTLAEVLAAEAQSPNSSVDAQAMLATVARLAPAAAGKRLLDVGSGFGFFTRAAQAHGYAVEAIELGHLQRQISREMTGIAPAATAFEAFAAAPESIDVVVMSQILEHAVDVDRWMAIVHSMMANGGLLAIALPNFGSAARRLLQAREPFICPPEHLNFFDAATLGRLLERHGFKVEAREWVTRVPQAALARRLPGAAQGLVPIVAGAAGWATRAIDAAGLGSVLRIYARKIGG